MDKPQFEHTCDLCLFLGSGVFNGKNVDWYIHHDTEFPLMSTLIARFSSDGPDYFSQNWDIAAKFFDFGYKKAKDQGGL
jgi:hypothetical protein